MAFKLVVRIATLALLFVASCTASITHDDDNDDIQIFPLIPHHVQRERRRLEDDNSGFVHQVGSLYQGYGTHYVDLWVGNPPQRQTVIVGTGSKYAAFPCSECDDCGSTRHIDRYFDDSKSSTFKDIECGSCFRFAQCQQSPSKGVGQCRFSEYYQEGSSWNAYEASDIAYLGGPHDKALKPQHHAGEEDGVDPGEAIDFSFRFTFGCQTNIQGLFKTQLADGMLGMCNCDVAFWRQMYGEGKLNRQQFSLCFNRQPVATREGKEAGAITLGGTDKRLHDKPMKFAPMLEEEMDFFFVRIKSIAMRLGGGDRVDVVPQNADVSIEEFNLPYSRSRAILDSGTTDTYLMIGYKNLFTNTWKRLTGQEFLGSGKRLMTVDHLPTLLFRLEISDTETMTVAFPPTHYMEYDAVTGTYTCRIYFDAGPFSDLGANFLMGHDVMFDVENKRIGFAESECDYSALVVEDAREQGSSSGSHGNTPKNQPQNNQQQRQSSSTGSKGGFCTGWGCRSFFVLVVLWVGGVVAAFVVRPDLRENVMDMIRGGRQRSLYHRTAVEIPMSSMDETSTAIPAIS